MADVLLNIQAKIKGLEEKLDKTNKELKKLGSEGKNVEKQVNQSFDNMKKKVRQFAMYFGVAIGGAAVVGAIKKSIDAMKEFEQTFSNVLTLLSEAERKKLGGFLREGTIELMRNYGFAIQDVNKALFDSISAGIKAGDSIKFMNEAAKLAKGGVTSLSIAVDGMTSIMNAYRLNAKDAEKVSAAFFTAQKYGKTTVEELASSIGRVAPIAKDANISYQEMLSALALLTTQGISTDEAVTGLRATIVALTNPAKQAQETLSDLGVESGKTAIRQNGLGKTLLQVARAAEKDADKLGEMIPNVRALTAVAALGEEALSEYDEILEEVNEDYGEGSSLAQAYTLQMGTLSSSIDRIKGGAETAKIALGKFFAPLIKGFADLIAPVEKSSEALIKQRTRLNLLAGAIISTSSTEESRLRLIEQLNAEYPDFLKGLDTEKVTNEEIEIALKNVNEQYEKKIKLAIAQEIYNQQAAELAALTLEESRLLIEQEEILNKNVDNLIGLQTASKATALVKVLFAKGLIDESKALAENILFLQKNRDAQKEQNEVTKKALENLNKLIDTYGKIEGVGSGIDDDGIDPGKTQSALDEILEKWWKHFLQIDTAQDDWAKRMIEGDNALQSAMADIDKEYNEAELEALRQQNKYKKQIEEDHIEFLRTKEEIHRALIEEKWNTAFALLDAYTAFSQRSMQKELEAAKGNEEKKEEIRKKYARKEQIMAVLRTIMAGAEGIVKTGANLGYPAAIPFQILQGIQTAAQIAIIASQKFEKGGYKILGGKRHADGGTRIAIGEAERGEGHAVFSRWATERYGRILPDLVDAINKGEFPSVDMTVQQKIEAGDKLMRFTHTVSLDESRQLEEIKKLLARDREQIIFETDREGNRYKITQKKGYYKKMKIR